MNTPDYAQEDLSVSKEMRRGREPSDDSSSASPSFAANLAFAAVAAASIARRIAKKPMFCLTPS